MTDLERVSREDWDAIVVGAGMGGATTGYALARAGWRVLFCEKGRSSLHEPDALRGAYAETHFKGMEPSERGFAAVLSRAGRETASICDLSGTRPRRFVPFIGSGSGGSSALYGMALERFFPADFTPRRHYLEAAESTLPERWPIAYDELVPFYEAAERLYRVRGSPDPLKDDALDLGLRAAPDFSPATREIVDVLERHGLHPYHLPMACAYVAGCRGCQGYLCASACKRDSGTVCLSPALSHHGATLLDECQVLRLEANRHEVTGVVCRRHGVEARLRARIVVLAAGALATPALLLRSSSPHWPHGLANTSRMVGRNLMRHFVDLHAVLPKHRHPAPENPKELGCNDFYVTAEGKFGSFQSFGHLPPPQMLVDSMLSDARAFGALAASGVRIAAPLIRRLISTVSSRALVFATILEDLPYGHNRVIPVNGSGDGLAIRYRIDDHARQRIVAFRRMTRSFLRPYRSLLIKQAESNQRLAHVCGTCRFGEDPGTSVLDRNNRTHDLSNVHVVDASFFPSSGGTNPALTIAANALRVAHHLLGRPDER